MGSCFVCTQRGKERPGDASLARLSNQDEARRQERNIGEWIGSEDVRSLFPCKHAQSLWKVVKLEEEKRDWVPAKTIKTR